MEIYAGLVLTIIVGTNTISSSFVSKLSRNMLMFAENYGNDTHYLCKAASLPILIPATILEMLKYNWCNRSLDEVPASLKSIIKFLNLCGPPTNLVDPRNYVDMQAKLANSQRDGALGQYLEHSRLKTMDSFVKEQQNTLKDFTTLLANLCNAYMFVVRGQLKSHNRPLIG